MVSAIASQILLNTLKPNAIPETGLRHRLSKMFGINFPRNMRARVLCDEIAAVPEFPSEVLRADH